jgi:hypothetical protein
MRTIKTTTISILALGLLAGSAVGVAAQDEEAAAEVTSFTGTLNFVDVLRESTDTELPNGLTESVGFTVLNSLESSDPRFSGDHVVVVNTVADPDTFGAGRPDWLLETSHVVTNDGGSWHGEGSAFDSTDLDLDIPMVVTFVGQDGYEGLTAYAVIEDPTMSGVIFPTAMPEMPEPYVAG